MKIKLSALASACAMTLVLGTAFAGVAVANPTWQFGGSNLSGSETVVGAAVSSSLVLPGMTTECNHFLYNMKVSNGAGGGQGEITELPLYECHTSTAVCTVESIGAEKLPWPTHLTEVADKPYLVLEGVEVSITYGGQECALYGTKVKVKGTAGGLAENSTHTATFNSASFSATKTALKVGTSSVEFKGVFPTEAFESHREQAVEVS